MDIKARLKNTDWKRVALSFAGVTGMAFFVSILLKCNLGTDPFTFMNKSISTKIGMSFGNWQLIINIVMFAIVLICKRRLIGFGTLFNMALIGYYVDFFDYVWNKTIPPQYFTDPGPRWTIFLISLVCFMFCAAVYINADTGVSPYDGLPVIITEKIRAKFPKIPKTLIRICWDGAAIGVGTAFGGVPIIGIILMALFLGPLITIVGKIIKPASKNA